MGIGIFRQSSRKLGTIRVFLTKFSHFLEKKVAGIGQLLKELVFFGRS